MTDLLDRVHVAAPCAADWDAMTPRGPHVRHCADCRLDVYDLSTLTRAEALALLEARTGKRAPCLRLYRRADGTLLTADCHVGLLPGPRRRRLDRWAHTATLLGLSLGALTLPGCREQVMGEVQCVRPPQGGPTGPVVEAPRELSDELHELVPDERRVEPAKRAPHPLPTATRER